MGKRIGAQLSPNLTAILLMTGAMALFSMGDAAVRMLTDTLARSVVIMGSGLGLLIVFYLVSLRSQASLFDRRALRGAALMRSLAELGAIFFMTLALASIPFTVVTLVLQAMPVVVTIGAALFFRETVGWRRWLAIFVGLSGVLIILQPGSQAFDPMWIIAVITMLVLSARDLITRAVPRSIATIQIAGWGGAAIFLGGVAMMLIAGDPLPGLTAREWALFTFLTIVGSTGIFAIAAAMRTGEVSVVAPFRYTRMPFGLLVGIVVFGESLTLNMVIGAVIILASGLYIWWREARLRNG